MTTLANLTTYISGENQSFLNTIEQTRGGLRSLVAALDPVAAATARYNRQVELLDKGLRNSRLTTEQHAMLMDRLTQRYQRQVEGQTSVTQSTGQMRAGMQQLSFQLGDIATQWASGTQPMIIFAQQSGQVIQAIGMMTNGAKGFLGFLAGPWGMILTAAVVALTPLISKLWEGEDAGNAAAKGVDAYTEALKRLQDQAGAFSFGSAEFTKVQGELFTAEARLNRLKAELKSAPAAGPTIITPGGTAPASVGRGRAQIESDIKAAEADAENKRTQMRALEMQRRNREIADRDAPKKDRKERTPRDRSSQQLERFQGELARMQDEQLSLQAQMTTDLHKRALIEDERLLLESDAYAKSLASRVQQKEITQAQADSLLLAHASNQVRKNTLTTWRLDEDLRRQELDLARTDIDLANQSLSGQLESARTQKERRRIQLEMLENEFKLLRLQAEEVLASKFATETEKEIARRKLARLDEQKGQRAAVIERQTGGPMADWFESLPKGADELNEALERLAVDGIQDVKDGLKSALLEGENLFDALGKAADRFVAKLLDMALDEALSSLFNMARGGNSGGGGFDFFGLFKSSQQGGYADFTNYKFKGLPGMNTGGEFKVGGLAGIDRNLLSINGIPRAMVSAQETVRVNAANDRGGAGTKIFDLRGAVVTQDLLDQMNAIAAGRAAQVVGRAGARAAKRNARRTG